MRDGSPRGNAQHGRDQRPASIQEVADLAKVSIATVSRVINNPHLVAAETGERVRKAIDALGFRPNRFAQGLTTRRSRVIGISLPDIHGEFYSAILKAADAEARREGYHLLVGSEPARDDPAGFYFPLGLVDGFALMLTEPNESLLATVQRAKVPLVLLDSAPGSSGLDAIVVDNEAGARDATDHLLTSTPPEACVFVGGPRHNFDAQQRSRAFRDALKRRGHGADASQIQFGSYSAEWGREWATRALSEGKLKGRGILAGNDEIALGILMCVQKADLRVPQDVAIVGFDNTRLGAALQPSLSSVGIPLAEMGAGAVQLILRRMNEPDAGVEVRHLPTSLVVRNSSTR